MENDKLTDYQEEQYFFRNTLSDASFMIPEWRKASAWIQHAPFAFFIVEAMKPRIYVELGTHYGYSFFTVCQAVQRFQLATQCYAVDTWQGDHHAGFYDDTVFREVEQHLMKNYSSFAYLKKMKFDEAQLDFEDGSVDLLHIDGRHFYEDIKHDFFSWLPKLSSRGIVMIHDTQVFERGFGVHHFWKQLTELRPSFEFFHGHGLGILSVGENIPEGLLSLLHASTKPKIANSVRNAYCRLGQFLE